MWQCSRLLLMLDVLHCHGIAYRYGFTNRSFRDAPWVGYAVILCWWQRRFLCMNTDCARCAATVTKKTSSCLLVIHWLNAQSTGLWDKSASIMRLFNHQQRNFAATGMQSIWRAAETCLLRYKSGSFLRSWRKGVDQHIRHPQSREREWFFYVVSSGLKELFVDFLWLE